MTRAKCYVQHPAPLDTASLIIATIDPTCLRQVRINGRWFALLPPEKATPLEDAWEQFHASL